MAYYDQISEPASNIFSAPLNPIIGDFEHNIDGILNACDYALNNTKDGDVIVITPELSLVGYPPNDLILHTDICEKASNALKQLLKILSDVKYARLRLFVGTIEQVKSDDIINNQSLKNLVANIALEIYVGKIVRKYAKRDLPNYSIFDEHRVFISGNDIDIDFITDEADKRFSVAICEDIWNSTPLNILPDSKQLIVMNASPWRMGINALRLETITRIKHRYNLDDVFYVNSYGGQDDLVFDGNGFICNSDNNEQNTYAHIYQSCVLGLRDYVQKNFGRVGHVVLGLSGGIDSALCATICVDAIGAKNVKGILMPSKYSSQHSIDDALLLASNLGIQSEIQPISALFDAYLSSLQGEDKELVLSEIAKQNIQARIRGNILMSYSNSSKEPMIVIATGNKSELAVGYSTIYGDAVGGYAPIKDVLKSSVWEIAKWRNSLSGSALQELVDNFKITNISKPIPENSITKPPSAELAPGQVDQDTLPEYKVLDRIINHLMGSDELSFNSSIKQSEIEDISTELVQKVSQMMKNAQWKRAQYPLGPKITKVSFGKDWRMPITYKSPA